MEKQDKEVTKKRLESSKKILWFCDTLLTCVVIATFVGLFLGIEVSSVVQLDISLSALSAAAHSFYYWKAKAENLRKYNQADKITMNEGDPIVSNLSNVIGSSSDDTGIYG